MRKNLLLLVVFAFAKANFLLAQNRPEPTKADQLLQSLDRRQEMVAASEFSNLPFENIGPTIMSGRVVDLEVNPDNPTEFYVAYASGGLWHTDNNGTSFTPVMDHAPTQNLGDIAVVWSNSSASTEGMAAGQEDQDNTSVSLSATTTSGGVSRTHIIYAGTGENNSSRSSYAGIGVIKSVDGGKTWGEPMLPFSHHIGRILIDPQDKDHVLVAVIGPLYSESDQRGIYRTRDGGKSWEQVLSGGAYTGFIDLAAQPDDFSTLYATSWERERKAWNFDGDGEGSAIYKSTDGGENWEKLTTEASGFPTGSGVGRIGLAVVDENTVYAVHDSQFRREKKKDGEKSSELEKDDFKNMSKSEFLALDNGKLNKFLKRSGFQEKYRADNVKNMVRSDVAKPEDLAKYLEDANSMLFDTPVKGAELYRSDDGGKTWEKTHKGNIDDIYYSYGYYFGEVRVDAQDPDHVYLMGVPIIKSTDGGKNWENISAPNVHADHHALWVNPKKSGHLINGNDGGVNSSYDDGASWIKNNTPAVGQFYAINYDHQQPYHVYGGLQDNGTWVGAHNAEENRGWRQNGKYPWEFIMGGDGMQIQIDRRNPDIVYTGFQFGNYYRLDRSTGERTYIQPKHELGESPYRFNWQTPILLSHHNQDILYLGGNKLHRSMNRGDDWTAISPDLTRGGRKGNVAYGTITSISESPMRFGYIVVGTDDGKIQLSQNGGADWQDISVDDRELWVSRVVASKHKAGRIYATLNGYRWDDFTPYIYISENHGKTWKPLGENLPLSPVNVIVEHPEDEQTLFIGTDDATYISMDGGANWQLMNPDMPRVAVHDLKIQPDAMDLLVGTHGRSIYKADLEPLELMDGRDLALPAEGTQAGFAKPTRAGRPDTLKHSENWGKKYSNWREPYEPEFQFSVYTKTAGTATVTLENSKGKTLKEWETTLDKGLNFIDYDMSIPARSSRYFDKEEKPKPAENGKMYLPVGTYSVTISVNGKSENRSLVLE